MTYRDNFVAILKRQKYDFVPVDYSLCPDLQNKYGERIRDFMRKNHIKLGLINSKGARYSEIDSDTYRKYFAPPLKDGAEIDVFGVGHEPGSEAAVHMTYMRNPLEHMQTLEELAAYPYPYIVDDEDYLNSVKAENAEHRARDYIIIGNMQCTVWERAWYMRSMERLMMDMLCEEELAEFILNYVTDLAMKQVEFYVNVGCDCLFLGDDIGMQYTTLMSEELYVRWLKPRLKRVIDYAKSLNPDVIIFYHSCGYVEPFIDHLVDAGVEVLNPVQPECMDFESIYKKYADRLSFHGTIGTQTTMPFGTAEDVKKAVYDHLDICGENGGLIPCPTHLLEPEVPPENIEAYLLACKEYGSIRSKDKT